MLTFDGEGYVDDKPDFAVYHQPHEILQETAINNGVKFFLMKNREELLLTVAENSQTRIPEIVVPPFDIGELEKELRQLDCADLARILNLKDREQLENFAKQKNAMRKSITIHKSCMVLSTSGTLFILASLIFKDFDPQHSVFESKRAGEGKKRASKEDFVYEHTTKVFGSCQIGQLHIIFLVCRSLAEQSQLEALVENEVGELSSPNKKQDVASVNKGREIKKKQTLRRFSSYINESTLLNAEENKPLNFKFSIVENRLLWVNFEDQSVW